MRKLIVFNHISLDGYFTDSHGDMSFARNATPDAEWDAFVEGNASGGDGTMVFGRVTYELMASFWPTPAAVTQMPVVANRMNSAPKVVFSRTLQNASWQNTRLVKGDLPGEIRKLKNEPGDAMLIFGSGTIVSQLAQAGLIDEYQFIVDPVVLGSGRTMFEGVQNRLSIKLKHVRSFDNGNVLLDYELIG
jgi:dihydrofolate reductase